MDGIRVSLFGQVRVEHLGSIAAEPCTVTHSLALLLALVLINQGRLVNRATIVNLLWADQSPERARACMNTALWRLRRLLEPQGISRGTYLIVRPTGEIGFNTASEHWVDSCAYERRLQQLLATDPHALTPSEVDQYASLIEAPLPEFLEGHFEDWVLQTRERLRMMYVGALAHLMENCRIFRTHARGLIFARKILEIDPLREDVHRAVMRFLAATGQRALAMRHFEQCQAVLLRELSVPPMAETVALYRAIASGSDSWQAESPVSSDTVHAPRTGQGATTNVEALRGVAGAVSPVPEALAELRAAAHHLDVSMHLLGCVTPAKR